MSQPTAQDVMARMITGSWVSQMVYVAARLRIPDRLDERSRLLVVESVIPPGNEPSFAKLLDLTMLVAPGGLERTEESTAGSTRPPASGWRGWCPRPPRSA